MYPSHHKPSVTQHSQTGSRRISLEEHSARTPTRYNTRALQRSNGAHGVSLELAAQYDLPWSGDAIQVAMPIHTLMPAVLRCSHTSANLRNSYICFSSPETDGKVSALPALSCPSQQLPRQPSQATFLSTITSSTIRVAQAAMPSRVLPLAASCEESILLKPPTRSLGHPLIGIIIWLSRAQTSANFLKWSTWKLVCWGKFSINSQNKCLHKHLKLYNLSRHWFFFYCNEINMSIYIESMQDVKSAHAHRAWLVEECTRSHILCACSYGFVTHTFWYCSSLYLLNTRHSN